jgi:hypothetical protein
MVAAVKPPDAAAPLCAHPHCARVATVRQRTGPRRFLCGWHGRIKKFGPVDRLDGAPVPAALMTIQFDNAELFDRLEAWCNDRTLTTREVCDYIVRKALDKIECVRQEYSDDMQKVL